MDSSISFSNWETSLSGEEFFLGEVGGTMDESFAALAFSVSGAGGLDDVCADVSEELARKLLTMSRILSDIETDNVLANEETAAREAATRDSFFGKTSSSASACALRSDRSDLAAASKNCSFKIFCLIGGIGEEASLYEKEL